MRMSTRPWYTLTRITPIFITGTAMAEIRGAAGKLEVAEPPKRMSSTSLPNGRRERVTRRLRGWLVSLLAVAAVGAGAADDGADPVHEVRPIRWPRKADGRTTIKVERRYQPALLGVAELEAIWVLYWFDRNDSPERPSILHESDQDTCKFLQARSAFTYSPTSRRSLCTTSSEA
jgi:hypothetical protein